MINGMNIFYSSKSGRGLEPIQTKGKGLEPIQTKSKGKEDLVTKNVITKNIKGQVSKF